MKLAIMQPYFFPYIGYWQMMAAVDMFVLYDNIQFSKGGWIQRNRILCNGKEKMISLPLKKDSDYLDVRDRYLSDSFSRESRKLLAVIENSYRKAPMFREVYPLIENAFQYKNTNLFNFIYHSIQMVCGYIGIDTPIMISSTLEIDHTLRNKYKVMEICRATGADTYINPIGGISLYSKDEFHANAIELFFLRPQLNEYPQFHHPFVPGLSMIDVMMFNSGERIRKMMDEYTLL